MPFCNNCGADVTNQSFCTKCGAPAGAARSTASSVAASSVPPTPAAVQPGATVPAGKPGKVSPIIWILAGIVGFIILIGIVLTAGGLFLAHKIRENPALVTARLLTAGNPDVEVLSADQGKNTVTFRNRKTGEVVTMNFDDIKKGKVVFKSNGQEAVLQARGDGGNGSLEINSPQGTVKFGAGSSAKIPDWIPAYPGATPTANFSMQGNDGEGGTFGFKTTDSAQNVRDFYEKHLTDAGFKITANVAGDVAASSGAMLAAEDSANRTVVVTLGTADGATNVNVVFGKKK